LIGRRAWRWLENSINMRFAKEKAPQQRAHSGIFFATESTVSCTTSSASWSVSPERIATL